MILTKDRKGHNVKVGDFILILSIDSGLISSLMGEELSLVQSIVGNVPD